MRKVILELAVSLDGFIEGPNGEYDWCFNDQDYGLTEFMKGIDAIFMGRKSYEIALKEPGPWKDMTTYVFTNSMKESPSGNVKLIRDMSEVEQILRQPGKDIWLFGGSDLVTQFLNRDLIDIVRMAVHPIILGKGKPLFQNINERKKLTLIDSKTFNTGLVSLNYSLS
jgi:dihydrofolate reductase